MHDEARQLLILILERIPTHSDSLYLLASIASLSGDTDLGESLLRQAIAIDATKSPYWVLLGNVLQKQNRLAESLQCYQTALTLDPSNVDVYYNAGNTLERQGNSVKATQCFEKALELNPTHLEALTNLANQYRQAGRFEDALGLLERARRLAPNAIPVLLNLGNVLMSLERHEEALECFDRCVQQDSQNAMFRNNKGNALRAMGRLSEALACGKAALALDPDCAELWVNYAVGLQLQGRQKEALEAFERILALSPENAIAHGAALFSMHYDPARGPARLRAEHRAWAARHADPLLPSSRVYRNSRDPEKRLRVGYVSSDFRRHPISFFTLPVFREHSDDVESICYSGVTHRDEWTERLRSSVRAWRDVAGLSDSELCEVILSDQVDILVDLAGHTAGNRLLTFARRPAPVQVSWLGYFNTTGMMAMDYLVVDSEIAPEGEPAPFVEQPMRLRGCYLCYEGPDYAPGVAPLPAMSRTEITFGCFNTQAKITGDVIRVWSKILKAAPQSRLILKNPVLNDEGCRQLVREEFVSCGLPAERLMLLGSSPHRELLESYAEVDIALDPFPYNGGTTTCEALWMGVPVVTLAGDRFVSRVGPTILRHAGCSEWVAADVDGYVRTAVSLAADRAKLAAIRGRLRDQVRQSPLGDTAEFTRSWEDALRMVWRLWCRRAE